MKYEFVRVEASCYQEGAIIVGPAMVTKFKEQIKETSYATSTVEDKLPIEIRKNEIMLQKDVVIFRFTTIGTAADGISNGDIDFQLMAKPGLQVFHDNLEQFTTFAWMKAKFVDRRDILSFIAVFAVGDNYEKRFAGLLPDDERLDQVLIGFGILKKPG